MTRYFVQRRSRALYVAAQADYDWWSLPQPALPQVCDHEPTDTGILDANGDPIMRAPNEMGFIWGARHD